jgi:1,4-dihydroxy-2-naphthoate octaprenyltransferase
MEKVKAWFLLCRPWSLTATAVPFMVFVFWKIAMAFGERRGETLFDFGWDRLGLAFVAAAALQLACNLLNTWGDNRSGVDNVPDAYVTTPQIQQGYATPHQVFLLALGFLAVTVSIGACLSFKIENGGLLVNWSLLAVGAVGVLGASNYATLLKFKYHGLGTPFVFFLMGPVFYMGIMASCLGFEFQNEPLSVHLATAMSVFFVSLPVASLVAVILFGNDMRDRLTDAAAGIKTAATVLGPRKTLLLFWVLHLFPYVHWIAATALLFAVSPADAIGWRFVSAVLVPFAVLPLSLKTVRSATADYRKNPENPYWFGYERASGKVHFLFGFLYSLAVVLALSGCPCR